MITGMRKLAGFVMINKILEQNDGTVFYDALHMLCGALRQYQSKVVHYMSGTKGCGARVEREIKT